MSRRAEKSTFYRLLSVCAVAVFCSCGDDLKDFFRDPDVSPVRKVLNVCMPLGYAANLTMAALNGAPAPNVTIARTGSDTSTGCFLAYIRVDSTFPLCGNMLASGRIVTAGISVDNKCMIMTAVFSELHVTPGSFAVRDISTFPVVLDSDLVTGKRQLFAVYADIDVNSGSDTLLTVGISREQISAELLKYQKMKSFDSGVSLTENAWIVMADDHGTLSDAYDDTYRVSGGGQYVDASNDKAEVVQLTMINAAMSPPCRFNPVAGWALWQAMGAGPNAGDVDIGHVLMTYHSSCDGKAKIAVATGVYTRSFGKEVALKLGEQ